MKINHAGSLVNDGDCPGAEADDAADPRSELIAEVVNRHSDSVRLRNSIELAARSGTLPFRTIGDYLDAGPEAPAAMLRFVRNFGRKTARELQSLIEQVSQNSTAQIPVAMARMEHGGPSADRPKLMVIFAGIPCKAIMTGELISARLLNVLRLSSIPDRPLVDVLNDFQSVSCEMLRYPNCGRKSVNEFRTLCERYVARSLAETGLRDRELQRSIGLIFHRPTPASNPDYTLEPVDTAEASVPNISPVPRHNTLIERLGWLLDELDGRAADIIRKRYGFGDASPASLEEVGEVYGVTRERIRQIEAKSLKRLRIRTRRAPLDELLAAEAPAEWARLSKGRNILRCPQKSLLSPEVQLALDLLDMDLVDWLNNIAVALPYGWHARGADADWLSQVGAAAEAVLCNQPIPVAISGLGIDAPTRDIEVACELVLGRRVWGGYIVPQRVGARLARALGLHALLAARPTRTPVDELVRQYHRCFPRDLCSGRDAEIVMEAAPHLFWEVEEDSWVALGAAGPLPESTVDDAIEVATFEEESGTIAHALHLALEDRGPTRLTDMLDAAPKILPPGRSVNSVGPMLIMRRDIFVRLLPGVYGLAQHVPRDGLPTEQVLSLLLNEQQARLYALARYAGEPIDLFPYWSPSAEYELCRWSRHSASREVFTSLLKVADVARWPLTSHDKEEWLFCQEREGRFELGSYLRQQIAYQLPDLDRIVAALIYAVETGSLNWMVGNRLTKRKLDSHGGVALLIVLLQLGALSAPPDHGFRWQMPHRVTDKASALQNRLRQELSRSGLISWESDVGRQIASEATAESAPESWVDPLMVASMFERGNRTVEVREFEESDPVELILAAHRRAKEVERREATLKWLLEE